MVKQTLFKLPFQELFVSFIRKFKNFILKYRFSKFHQIAVVTYLLNVLSEEFFRKAILLMLFVFIFSCFLLFYSHFFIIITILLFILIFDLFITATYCQLISIYYFINNHLLSCSLITLKIYLVYTTVYIFR